MTYARYRAILLLGPTGTGKTPLGQQLETRDLWNKKYHHFDFGQSLRNAVDESGRFPESEVLEADELEKVRNLLETNSLLEDSDFTIAEKLLENFIERRNPDPVTDVIVLNGLPRHRGQAEAVGRLADVRLVIMLSAAAETIHERIGTNAGGDRKERDDDSVEEINRKLSIFMERTMPLVQYYRELDRTILDIAVETDTIPLFIIQGLETMPCLV